MGRLIETFNRILHDRDHNKLGPFESANMDRLAKILKAPRPRYQSAYTFSSNASLF